MLVRPSGTSVSTPNRGGPRDPRQRPRTDNSGRRPPGAAASRPGRRGPRPGARPPAPPAGLRRGRRAGAGLVVDPVPHGRPGRAADDAGVRPALPDGRAVLPRPDRRDAGHHRRGRPLAARDLPARADRRPAGRRQGPGAGQGGRAPLARPVPGAAAPSAARWAARRAAACCSRARPGTGKTHMAKAMAAEAGVPFLFVSAHLVPVDVLRRHRAQDPLVLQGAAQGRPRGGRRDRLHRGDRRDRHRPRRHERLGRAAAARARRLVDDVLRRARRPARAARPSPAARRVHAAAAPS